MCSLSVSQPGSNFSIGPLPFSSFPVFSVEDELESSASELESSASAADAAGEADAAWGDAAWGDAAWGGAAWGDAAEAAEPSSSSSEDAASLLDAPASALAPLLSEGGLLDAAALTDGESETVPGEGGALPDDSALLAASASDESLPADEELSSGDDPRPGIVDPRRIAPLFQSVPAAAASAPP